jgi:hypothetical protein
VANARFEIGEKERHFFTVDWNIISKRIKIEQDGEMVANELRFHTPFARRFRFDIGSSEPHHVEMIVGPFHPIELLVDGRPAHPLL